MTRQRLILIAIAAVLILLAYNFLVYQPRQARYRTLSAELATRQAERDRLQGIVARTQALEQQFSELQSTIAVVEAKLPEEKEIPELLVLLEQLVTSLNVDLAAIAPAAVQAPPAPPGGGAAQPTPYAFIPVRLRVTATYQQLVELMGALQDFPRLMAVKTISVGPGGLPKLSVDMNAETYVLVKGAQ